MSKSDLRHITVKCGAWPFDEFEKCSLAKKKGNRKCIYISEVRFVEKDEMTYYKVCNRVPLSLLLQARDDKDAVCRQKGLFE
jgi:hypothetical protein